MEILEMFCLILVTVLFSFSLICELILDFRRIKSIHKKE